MSERQTSEIMSRGILTDAEKRAIAGEIPDENRTSTYISRAKKRIESEVAADAEFLRENRVDLYDLLHEAVCEQELAERVEELENEVEELRERPLSCPECGEGFDDFEEWQEHVREELS